MKDSQATTGISASFLLFLTFMILKLSDVIDWSWWWVTSPLWIFIAIALLIFTGSAIVILIFIKRSK